MPTPESSSHLTDKQLQIAMDLRELDPAISDMYLHCIELIEDYSEDAPSARVDISIIGHGMREIINRLPDVLVGGPRKKSKKGVENNARKQLVSEYDRYADQEFAAVDDGIRVPVELFEAMNNYVKAVHAGGENEKARDLIALSESGMQTPAYSPWKNARDFFVGFAHLDGEPDRKLPSPDEVKHHFETVESAISVRMGQFFEAKSELVEILESANAIVDGGYKQPSEVNASRAMSMMGSLPLRRVFYSRLENPKWIVVLDRLGAFRSLPTEGNESVEYDYWPESNYLRRCVDSDPEAVTGILMKAPFNSNLAVKDAVVQLASMLPAEYAEKLAVLIKKWAEAACGTSITWCDTDELATLISNLLEAESTRRTGDGLLYVCFGFAESQGRYGLRGQSAIFTDHKYMRCLQEALRPYNAKERTVFCIRMIKKYCDLRFGNRADPLIDWYYPSISAAANHGDADASNALIATLVESLRELAKDDEGSFLRTFKDDNQLVRRSCLLVLEEVVRASDTDATSLLLEEAVRLANSDLIFEEEFDAELIPLVRTVCAMRGKSTISELLERLASSKDPSYERLEEKWQELGTLDESVVEDLRTGERLRRHKILSLIGRENLEGSALRILDELDAQFGSNDDYRLGHVHSSRTITGPNSPLTVNQMQVMDVDDLMAFLKTWQPSEKDRFELVSCDGVGIELQKLIAASPTAFNGRLDEVKALRPRYVRAVVEGWREALASGGIVPLPDVIDLATYGAQLDEGRAFANLERWDEDDSNYAPLKLASLRVIEGILDDDGILEDAQLQPEKLLQALAGASRSTEPDAAYEEKYGGDNMDPVNLAMNTIRPMALIGLVKWVARFHDNAKVNNALEILREHMPDKSASEADVGALIQTLPLLEANYRDWLVANREALFGKDEPNKCQQAMLTGILTMWVPREGIHELVGPAIETALMCNCDAYCLGFGRGWGSCSELIGNWLYHLAAEGRLSLDDDLIMLWREKASSAACGSVLDHLCFLVKSVDDVDPSIVERVCAIWDCHAQMVEQDSSKVGCLRGIACLAECGVVESNWWGPRLVKEIKSSERYEHLGFLEDQLLEYSEENPRGAFEVLEAYVSRSRNIENARYSLRKIAPTVLANVLRMNETDARNRAKRVMDKLGTWGFIDLDEQVANCREAD